MIVYVYSDLMRKRRPEEGGGYRSIGGHHAIISAATPGDAKAEAALHVQAENHNAEVWPARQTVFPFYSPQMPQAIA
jgi:hypothetical protein